MIEDEEKEAHDMICKDKARARGKVTEEEFKQFKIYAAAVFQNCGNFKSFGDTKFVPELHPHKFRTLVQA